VGRGRHKGRKRGGLDLRIAAVGDLHCTKTSQGKLAPIFAHAAERADVLLLAGDLTDYGQPDEAHVLARELAAVKMPTIAVLGNHDFESGQQDEVKRILVEGGIHVLDGDAHEIEGVGFAGVKGFAGGFGQRALGPWGENAIKIFVQEAVDEALKLEAALARLRTPVKVVLLHYAPIEDTVRGEPPTIFPFLGSSRLEEPIDRYHAHAVFHGHAHSGSPDGRTKGGIPVYNVSLPLLRSSAGGGATARIVEVGVPETEEAEAEVGG
jgi:Icc-related predicted phosphoesterase